MLSTKSNKQIIKLPIGKEVGKTVTDKTLNYLLIK